MKLKATYGQIQGDYIMCHNYDTTSLRVWDLIFLLWNVQKVLPLQHLNILWRLMHYFYISVQLKFDSGEYSKISEFVTEVRCLLLNCYTYFGPNDIHTQKALKVEQVLKQKLALLPV
jgi:hypothetical protein